MKRKRRYQRNKKLGIKNSNDMEIHEIEVYNGESIEMLHFLNLLKKHSIVHYLDQINNTSILNIYRRDIDKIYDILINEFCGNGYDAVTGYLNDYGKIMDNFLGMFGIIKGEKDEMEKLANKKLRSRKKLKYNRYNEI